jgi:multiple sugar transport system ATP-binding protein
MVLVGPSGCGKTTALRMVAGLEHITAGTVSIGGRVVNDVSESERDIAMVFQNYALYPHLSVQDNIAFPLKLGRVKRREREERVRRVAEILGLTSLLGQKPAQLSGGQRQRVAMGRAIVREPQLFLMDEPLSNLDAKLRVQMRGDILELQRELQTTTMYVTHDQAEAMTLGDRVAVMRDGRLQQLGSPETVYDDPVNMFVAGFLGSPPMNLVDGRLSADGGRVTVTIGSAAITLDGDELARYADIGVRVGAAVVGGVPPEGRQQTPAEDERTLRGIVTVRESLGSDVYVRVRAESAEEHEAVLMARLPATALIARGERVSLSIAPGALRLFDAETGGSLAHATQTIPHELGHVSHTG